MIFSPATRSLTIILSYIFIFPWDRAGKQIKQNVSTGNVFPMVSNVIFMYLQMKSSRVSCNTYNHIFQDTAQANGSLWAMAGACGWAWLSKAHGSAGSGEWRVEDWPCLQPHQGRNWQPWWLKWGPGLLVGWKSHRDRQNWGIFMAVTTATPSVVNEMMLSTYVKKYLSEWEWNPSFINAETLH